MADDSLSTLMELREDPYSSAREWKERTGGKVVGFFCCLAPEELIHAAGALPVRITGENRVIARSAAHLQSYCCSLARTGLDMALEGDLDFMDGTVFVHTCDTMQRLSDIWRLDTGFAFHGDLVLPVRVEGEAAREYARREFEAFRSGLEEFLGPVTDEALRESIAVYNRNRELLARLYEMRRADPSLLPYGDALWLVTSSALMDKSEHNALLERVLDDLSARGGGGHRVPLFGIGSVMDQWDFLRMVQEVGATLVDDDFCNGRRYFEAPAPREGDPLEALVERLWNRPACACKHLQKRDRASEMLERVQGSGARGALFFEFKFCEPHLFDYPHIKKALDGVGVPSLHLEIEQGSVSIEQLRTRVEALVETIRG